MPIWPATCALCGPFEVIQIAGVKPERISCPTCANRYPVEVAAPAIRFRGDGFQTPRAEAETPDTGATLKQDRY